MKYIILIALILVTTVVLAEIIITKDTEETDSIKYKTIAEFDGFEIREYPEYLVASTSLKKDSYSNNSRKGFKRVASYIFGGNSANMQISMTSPVQMDMSDSNSSMSFFMPADMTLDQLPQPNGNDVEIKTEPAKKVAVIQFSGWASDKKLEEKFQELKSLLTKENIDFEDSYYYLGYNPPYQLVNRRNEIIIKINR